MQRTGSRRWRKTSFDLTERQEQVLRLIERGYSNGEIAERLGITLDGAKFHVSEILGKLDVSNREEAVSVWNARRRGSMPLPSFALSLRLLAVVAGGAVVIAAAIAAWAATRADGDSVGAANAPPASPIAAAATAFQCPLARTPTPTLPPAVTATPAPPVDGPFSVRFNGRWYSMNSVMGAIIPADRVPANLVGRKHGEICFASKPANWPAEGDVPRDGDSFGLTEGMEVHLVVGYDPRFRLALAIPGQEPILLEVREFDGAVTGADLLDLRGKAVRLDVYGDSLPESPGGSLAPAPLLGSMTDSRELDALVDLLLSSPVGPIRQPPEGAKWYALQFTMRDGTHVSRQFGFETAQVWPGIGVPSAFVAEIEQILAIGP